MTSHLEIAKAFGNGEDNIKGRNLFVENGIAYSYGHHFKIAQRYGEYTLFNKNGYSSSTAKHKSYVLRYIKNPIILNNCDPELADLTIGQQKQEILSTYETFKRATKHKTRYATEIKTLWHNIELIRQVIQKQETTQEEDIQNILERINQELVEVEI